MSDTKYEVMEVIEESPYQAKVQQLRAWAPFVGTLMTIFRHNMTEDKWIKLKNLESDMSSAMFACYTESRLTRLETTRMLNEAKIKYDSLYHHTELIVIDDDANLPQQALRWQPTKKLRVCVARCAQLEEMLKESEQANSQPVAELQEESVFSVSDTLGMPPTRPDEDQLLVINECKLQQSEYMLSSSQAERLERATISVARISGAKIAGFQKKNC